MTKIGLALDELYRLAVFRVRNFFAMKKGGALKFKGDKPLNIQRKRKVVGGVPETSSGGHLPTHDSVMRCEGRVVASGKVFFVISSRSFLI
jgi:hypothetical protein